MKNRFNLQHILALRHAHYISLNQLLKLYNHVEQLDEIQQISRKILNQLFNLRPHQIEKMLIDFQRFNTPKILRFYKEQNISLIPFWSDYYPGKLMNLIDPPLILFCKGNIELLKSDHFIACIGSRYATEYSVQALQFIIPPLVERDVVIVSGLAKGADTMAHEAAIHYGGKTIAVLGHGLHMVYPKENTKIAQLIGQSHLLLSEYTFLEGPKKFTFPMRNRIISGLSDGLIVTEAGVKSGTLITTEHALEHGKDVFVVPGPITSKQSEGTNKLLREGAIPVWNGYQIVEELSL